MANKKETDETPFVEVSLTELLNHHSMVNDNIVSDRFEADRQEAIDKFGLSTSEGTADVKPPKSAARKNGKQQETTDAESQEVLSGTGPEDTSSIRKQGPEEPGDGETESDAENGGKIILDPNAPTGPQSPADPSAPVAGDKKPWELGD